MTSTMKHDNLLKTDLHATKYQKQKGQHWYSFVHYLISHVILGISSHPDHFLESNRLKEFNDTLFNGSSGVPIFETIRKPVLM